VASKMRSPPFVTQKVIVGAELFVSHQRVTGQRCCHSPCFNKSDGPPALSVRVCGVGRRFPDRCIGPQRAPPKFRQYSARSRPSRTLTAYIRPMPCDRPPRRLPPAPFPTRRADPLAGPQRRSAVRAQPPRPPDFARHIPLRPVRFRHLRMTPVRENALLEVTAPFRVRVQQAIPARFRHVRAPVRLRKRHPEPPTRALMPVRAFPSCQLQWRHLDARPALSSSSPA
jgi:hypothetical protein